MVRGLAVAPVGVNVNTPFAPVDSFAVVVVAETLTLGSVVPSTILTVAAEGEPTVYAALDASVRITVSVLSAMPSLTGTTFLVTEAEPAGIVTEVPSAV